MLTTRPSLQCTPHFLPSCIFQISHRTDADDATDDSRENSHELAAAFYKDKTTPRKIGRKGRRHRLCNDSNGRKAWIGSQFHRENWA